MPNKVNFRELKCKSLQRQTRHTNSTMNELRKVCFPAQNENIIKDKEGIETHT